MPKAHAVRSPAQARTSHGQNAAPPNMALQPKGNGLPPLGLHFILAQSRQPVAFG